MANGIFDALQGFSRGYLMANPAGRPVLNMIDRRAELERAAIAKEQEAQRRESERRRVQERFDAEQERLKESSEAQQQQWGVQNELARGRLSVTEAANALRRGELSLKEREYEEETARLNQAMERRRELLFGGTPQGAAASGMAAGSTVTPTFQGVTPDRLMKYAAEDYIAGGKFSDFSTAVDRAWDTMYGTTKLTPGSSLVRTRTGEDVASMPQERTFKTDPFGGLYSIDPSRPGFSGVQYAPSSQMQGPAQPEEPYPNMIPTYTDRPGATAEDLAKRGVGVKAAVEQTLANTIGQVVPGRIFQDTQDAKKYLGDVSTLARSLYATTERKGVWDNQQALRRLVTGTEVWKDPDQAAEDIGVTREFVDNEIVQTERSLQRKMSQSTRDRKMDHLSKLRQLKGLLGPDPESGQPVRTWEEGGYRMMEMPDGSLERERI